MFALWENLISCRNVFGDGEYELDVVGGKDPGQLSDGGIILEEKRDITLVYLETEAGPVLCWEYNVDAE